MTACERTNRWVEEVHLSDGTVLRVTRAVQYRPPGGGLDQSRDARLPLQERLIIEAERDSVWSEPHRVAAYLDRRDGRLWIVGRLTTACEQGFRGEPMWVAYTLDGTDWVRIEAASAPKISTPNLLLDSTTYRVTKHLSEVTLETKSQLDRASQVSPLIRSIDLQLVPKC